ncbi:MULTISPECIES: non-specific lipid-transfer protein [Klebsiella pneumoniae complex]
MARNLAEDATCNPTELQPCAEALRSGSAPSSACCSKLKAQSPCICGYLSDPRLKPYTGRARQVAASCGLPFPKC